jgi:hypothetical protein
VGRRDAWRDETGTVGDGSPVRAPGPGVREHKGTWRVRSGGYARVGVAAAEQMIPAGWGRAGVGGLACTVIATWTFSCEPRMYREAEAQSGFITSSFFVSDVTNHPH